MLAALLTIIAGPARAADSSPGWSGTVKSEYTQYYTYGETSNPATVLRVQRGSLQTDGTSEQGDGELTYTQSYEDSGPPSEACPEGTDITQNASGTAFSHGALQGAIVDSDGTYTIAIGGDAAFSYSEHRRECGQVSDSTFLYGAYLPAAAPVARTYPDGQGNQCPGPPTVPAEWDGTGLRGSYRCDPVEAADSTVQEHYVVSWNLTRLADRDHDGFPDVHDSCPDQFAGPDSTDGCPTKPACSDGFDNDGDNKADFPADPGCESAADTSEVDPPACSDGRDNDGDGAVDYGADPGCASAADTSEDDPAQCGDGIDNDGNGTFDFPADSGCDSVADPLEASVASFEWSMPERYDGADRNGDGLPDSFTGLAPVSFSPVQHPPPIFPGELVDPHYWRVQFHATGACARARAVQWVVAGGQTVDGGCDQEIIFPDDHVTRNVTLRLDGVAAATKPVLARDYLIASIGDSYGSGEGNPDVPRVHHALRHDTPSRWEDKQCHRSAKAGASLAAEAVEAADRHSSVTLVHLSCSGATIPTGILGRYAGASPDDRPHAKERAQLQELKALAGSRDIDALHISIGGNDLGFSNIITACLVETNCADGLEFCTHRLDLRHLMRALLGGVITENTRTRTCAESGKSIYGDGLSGLSHRFRSLAACLPVKASARAGTGACKAKDADVRHKLPARAVILTAYPDPTHSDSGSVCGTNGTKRLLAGVLLPAVLQISGKEASWAGRTVLAGLNNRLRLIAAQYGWRYVDQHVTASRRHGDCAKAHWFKQWDEAKRDQEAEGHGLLKTPGAAHPNELGHEAYAKALLATLRRLGLP